MENRSTILGGLDRSQREAVECVDGPVLIVAGAGSGKTRVLTSRIAYLLERGVEPDRILALTFTKKAATEMKERIAAMVGARRAMRLYMGTFHAVFVRILKEYAEFLGYPSSFTIYDTSDSQSAIKRCVKELGLDEKVYKPKDVLGRISMAKNNLVSWQAYKNNFQAIQNDIQAKKPRVADIYQAYQTLMRQAGVMDFDDILMNMNVLLRDNPQAWKEIASRFDYIMVDEYQDTNFSQYLILRKLSDFHRNICVVGDDSQSIYAFRGAKIENILRYQKDYPGCHVFRLEQNYRSTQVIVDAANSLIAKNENRIPKTCYSKGDEGSKIRLNKAYSEQDEAEKVVSSIVSNIRTEHLEYKDFAILYRTNNQSRVLEEVLRKHNIPYMIYSGNSFYDRAEVKTMMAYFKLVINPNDDESFRRVVNEPARGIGDTTLNALAMAARSQNISMMKAIYGGNLEQSGLKSAAISRLQSFAGMIMGFNMKLKEMDALTLAKEIVDASKYYEHFKLDNSIESQSRAANIGELVNSVKSFVDERVHAVAEEKMAEGQVSDETQVTVQDALQSLTLDLFMENAALMSAVDVEEGEDGNNKVALMTVHSSKGLEFPYVYIVGMEENIFPSGGMSLSLAEVEEERRLFYVALTRAKVAVALSFADSRMRNGNMESNSPSRFIKEIDSRYIDNPLSEDSFRNYRQVRSQESRFGGSYGQSGKVHYEQRRAPGPSASSSSKFSPELPKRVIPVTGKPLRQEDPDFIPMSPSDIKVGMVVEHSRFGIGKVMNLEGSAGSMSAIVDFQDYGTKKIILAYAKFRLPKH